MPEWSARDMHELGATHARLEAQGDLEGTMATLVEEPTYEFWPAGLRMVGKEQVRRYYVHLLTQFVPMTRSYTLIDEWVNPRSLLQEYEIQLDVNGSLESHRVVGILFAEGNLLGGERIFASERCMRLMAGDVIDELPAIQKSHAKV